MLLVDSRSAAWAVWRLVRGPRALRGVPGLRWAKVLGSGSDAGFTLKPSATRGGLFCVFADAESAAQFVTASPTLDEYRRQARELCTATLRPYASRGSWDGHALPVSAGPPGDGPVAVLTRASIRLQSAAAFWRRAPAAQRALRDAPGCRLAAGLGEAPLLRQATFSVWDSVQAMEGYARRGAHLQAARAAQQGGHFSEAMFVRFLADELSGTWKGVRLD